MADNTILEQVVTAGDTLATDDIGAYKIPISKIHTGGDGVDGGAVTAANAFPVDIASATLDVALGTDISDVFGTSSVIGAGTEAGAIRVTIATDSTGVVSVDDNGGNLSVDWGGTVPPIGAGLEATALRVTVATDSTGVLSVDDNGGSLTVDNGGTFAVQEDGAALTALQKLDNIAHSGSDVALVEHVPISGQLDDTATTTVTENQIAPVRITSARALHVAQQGVVSVDDNAGSLTVDDGGVNLSVDWDGTAPPIGAGTEAAALRVTVATDSTGVLSVDDGGGVLSTDWNGTAPPIGAGLEATALRVTVATDSTGVLSVDDNGTTLSVDDGGGALTVDGTVTVDAGTGWMAGYTEDAAGAGGEEGPFTIGRRQDADTSPVGADGDYHGLIFNDEGDLKTVDKPVASGGLSMHKTISAASDNATSVKASAGQLYAVQVFNTNASARYLKLYDKASAPTVGTDTPVKTLLIPGNSTGAGMVLNWDKGLEFTAGIGFGLTTGIADSDTNAVAANEIAVDLDYR